MASLYRKRDIWYISLMVNNKRISKSLRTKDYKTAKTKISSSEISIIKELKGNVKSNARLTLQGFISNYGTPSN